MKLNDTELLYAATSRCRCGAGLAYPLEDFDFAMKLGAWMCSRVLRGEIEEATASRSKEHDCLPWAFVKVREETSINNILGASTRPAGTVARTIGSATCPKCGNAWESEPYSACGTSHHWFSGPCPRCGYAVGGEGTCSSDDGEPIKCRYRDVVLSSEVSP